MIHILGALVVLVVFSLANNAIGFQLSPVGTKAEREFAKRWGVTIKAQISISEYSLNNFSDPIHETITQKIFNCDGDWSHCSSPDLEYAGPFIIAGIRWNDDPVFLLNHGEGANLRCNTESTVSFVTQTRCWIGLFNDASKKSKKNPDYFLAPGSGNYMSRSHFGDLQFLHGMAAKDGELASLTKQRILMWAEFVWGIKDGTYKLGTNLRDVEIYGWAQHFSNNQNVQDLFTVGRPWLRLHIEDVAFGSLLHLIQDSFSRGHVDRRDPISGDTCLNGKYPKYGKIREFHSYSVQNHERHKEADSVRGAQSHIGLTSPDVIDAGKTLLAYYSNSRLHWEDVRPFLDECLFELEDENSPATPGREFL
jgi:hypothetical protein